MVKYDRLITHTTKSINNYENGNIAVLHSYVMPRET
jgi:hypothetical protein